MNTTNPISPFLVSALGIDCCIYGISVLDRYAYLSCSNGLRIVDVHNSVTPLLIGSLNKTLSIDVSLKVIKNYVYLSDVNDGLRIIGLSHFSDNISSSLRIVVVIILFFRYHTYRFHPLWPLN